MIFWMKINVQSEFLARLDIKQSGFEAFCYKLDYFAKP